jgi:hypothetical protein
MRGGLPGAAPGVGTVRSLLRLGLVSVVAAFVLSAQPVAAATTTAKWTARVGSNAYYGTVTVSGYSTGTGSMALALKHIPASATFSRSVYAGTCSRLSTRVVVLGSVKSSASSTLTRTSTLTSTQISALKRYTSLVVRFVSGSHVYCATLKRVTVGSNAGGGSSGGGTGGSSSGWPNPSGWDGVSDVDCGDFATHDQAQAFFIAHGGPGSDPFRLDGDSDGSACESLP